MADEDCAFARDGNRVTADITVPPALIRRFLMVFGRGMCLEVTTGVSIRRFLLDQLCLADDYVEGRIQTIFLNGRAVDDIDGAVLFPGCVLALSGAMPGLVGATMRRGGRYAVLRRDISYDACKTASASGDAFIRVKLFNLLTREMGPDMLERGGWLEPVRVVDLLSGLQEEIDQAGGKVETDGPMENAGAIFLRVRSR